MPTKWYAFRKNDDPLGEGPSLVKENVSSPVRKFKGFSTCLLYTSPSPRDS